MLYALYTKSISIHLISELYIYIYIYIQCIYIYNSDIKCMDIYSVYIYTIPILNVWI